MYGDGMMNGWGMMNPLIWIFMVLLWGLAIFGLICAVRWLLSRGTGKGNQGSESHLDILKARREISKEQFEQMRKDLE